MPLAFASPATVQDVIETDGRARWYRFPIFPNQRVTISLSGLSADYELAVFKDIGAEFESQLDARDSGRPEAVVGGVRAERVQPVGLQSLGLQPERLQPRCICAERVQPIGVQPERVLAIGLQPIGLQPERVLAIGLQPIGVQPERVLAIGLQSIGLQPIGLQPQRVQRRRCREGLLERADRSLIGVSATPGTGDETVVVNSWNETGEFYVRVAGRGGAFDPSNLFTLTVTPAGSECTGSRIRSWCRGRLPGRR